MRELLTVGPRLAGMPKAKSAFASPLTARRTPAATKPQMRISFIFLFLFMIDTSISCFFFGLLYYDKSLNSGVQTIRPGRARPVSVMLDGVILTGCFFTF
jgi:hypothetical protein